MVNKVTFVGFRGSDRPLWISPGCRTCVGWLKNWTHEPLTEDASKSYAQGSRTHDCRQDKFG